MQLWGRDVGTLPLPCGQRGSERHEGHLAHWLLPLHSSISLTANLRTHKNNGPKTKLENRDRETNLHRDSTRGPFLLFMHFASGWHLAFYIWQQAGFDWWGAKNLTRCDTNSQNAPGCEHLAVPSVSCAVHLWRLCMSPRSWAIINNWG